jgi:predicted nucleotidyltransferase
MITQELVNRAVQVLIYEANPQRIVLFGSLARNEGGPQSDADFLIVTNHCPENRFAMATRLRRSLSPIGIPVDIVVHDAETVRDWADTPGTLLYTIQHEGKVVYEKL